MAGLCEGGNEPPGSLNASNDVSGDDKLSVAVMIWCGDGDCAGNTSGVVAVMMMMMMMIWCDVVVIRMILMLMTVVLVVLLMIVVVVIDGNAVKMMTAVIKMIVEKLIVIS
ncbi:hypothetical protein ANN_11075 [Periplaneta americana]|uniref:Uncharacterized protein n=1 Tax=Periplaneta americana TaxID=6978 RepID=A0ABQ8T407_PERAM|nr:hypothetical protein ANN_11075 [Periplaneta americana]